METGNRSTDHEKTASERGCGDPMREKTSSERGCGSAVQDLIRGATDSSRVHLWQFRSLFLVDAALSQNTLLLSKVEACQIVTDKAQYDLTEQIRRCVLLLLPQMEQKNITPVIDLPEMTWYGNAELMEQVWINLLNNALKFTPEGGTITAAGKICAEHLRVTIADDGVGMSEETVPHIFEKYYQNDQVSAVRGNGIGLSIVARIVQLSGGQVEVESRRGEGSAFTVVLPAAGFPCIQEKAFDRKGETAI